MSNLRASAIKHNGANTNLYCDGKIYFVTGCPACDCAYDEQMKPRWARAKVLAAELAAAGMTDTDYHADLWKINAKGTINGRLVKVQELNGSELAWWL